MKALIEPSGRVAQVEAEPFPVAEPLRWVDCPDDARPDTHYFDGERVVANPPPPTPSHNDQIDAQIVAIEGQITQRMLRDAAAGSPPKEYRELVARIDELRGQRRK